MIPISMCTRRREKLRAGGSAFSTAVFSLQLTAVVRSQRRKVRPIPRWDRAFLFLGQDFLRSAIPRHSPKMTDSKSTTGFVVRLAARFLKDPAISSDAKALRAVLGAYADGRTGCTYVLPGTLEEILGWGRGRREAAQRELVRGGWLRLGWKRGARARWARRIYFLTE
jgi:hypothetical protein